MTKSPPATPGDNVLGALGQRDAAAHRALVLRTLDVDEDVYAAILAAFAAGSGTSDDAGDLERRITRLRGVFLPRSPHEGTFDPLVGASCPMCRGLVRAVSARRVASDRGDLVYGACAVCGHGVLLSGAAPSSIYDADYHRVKTSGGAGYAAYADEASYRENKGERLLERLGAFVSPGTSLLEIGSGYGYTRIAAERRGLRTTGVDPSAGAAAEAKERYGLETFVGTLAEGLDAGTIPRDTFDLALYQFVLEHIADPLAELRLAASTLRSGGRLVAVVPNMAAAERDAFGAAYRSFRADHLHLFTRDSLALAGRATGLSLTACASECSLHLLVDFVSPPLLATLYARGDGPDLLATFTKDLT